MGDKQVRELIENMIEESDCDKCAGYGFFEEGCTTCVSTRVARILTNNFTDIQSCKYKDQDHNLDCKNLHDESCVKCMAREFIEFIKGVEIE